MRIAHITSGAGGMYCGSCMNANTVAAALIARGHEVALIPTYTPMRVDEASVADGKIFFGALNVYLQQRFKLFRKTPRLLDWVLDRPALLDRLMKWSYEVDNAEIGALTLSVLEGESGHQAKELEKLVAWLADDFKPDIVQLSFAFFLGFARRFREALGVPVVCTVQGEEIMLDQLPKHYRETIVSEMRRRARDVHMVISPSHDYSAPMRELLDLPAENMHVAELGIAADDYLTLPSRALDGHDRRPSVSGDPVIGAPVIGYLARICPEKGLHVLVDAFREVAAAHDTARLRVAGFLAARDKKYLEEQRQKIAEWGLTDRVEIIGEVDRQEKLDFLAGLDLFSVPTIYREPKGLFLLEAMASGIPVVAPNHGSFPELLASGGGEIVPVDDASALASSLLGLLRDEDRRRNHAERGRATVRDRFTADHAAARIESLYERLLAGEAVAPAAAEATAAPAPVS